METRIVDNPKATRFEIFMNGEVAGLVAYTRDGDTLSLLHTEIDPRFEGRGLGSILVRGVLDAVRADGALVLPFCPFIRRYLQRHTEYVDLVPAEQRAKFELTDG